MRLHRGVEYQMTEAKIHIWIYKEEGLRDSQPLFDEEELEDLLGEVRKISKSAFWWGGSNSIRSLMECPSTDFDFIKNLLQKRGLGVHIFSRA